MSLELRQIFTTPEAVSVDDMVLEAERLRLLARIAELETELEAERDTLQGGQ